MYTMVNDENLHKLFAEFYEAKKIAAIANADHTVFVSGNDAEAKGVVVELLQGFGWKDITDLGDITSARGTEMLLPIWLRLWGTLGTPDFNFKIVRNLKSKE